MAGSREYTETSRLGTMSPRLRGLEQIERAAVYERIALAQRHERGEVRERYAALAPDGHGLRLIPGKAPEALVVREQAALAAGAMDAERELPLVREAPLRAEGQRALPVLRG